MSIFDGICERLKTMKEKVEVLGEKRQQGGAAARC